MDQYEYRIESTGPVSIVGNADPQAEKNNRDSLGFSSI